jgi:hypothetical protein
MGGMPTPEARAAFDDAQRIAEHMRALHDQELALQRARESQTEASVAAWLDQEIVQLRRVWANFAGDYTAAVARFTSEVDKARDQK